MIEATNIPPGELIQLPPLNSMQLSILSLGFTAVYYTSVHGPEAGETILVAGLLDMLVRSDNNSALIRADLKNISKMFDKLANNFKSREDPNA